MHIHSSLVISPLKFLCCFCLTSAMEKEKSTPELPNSPSSLDNLSLSLGNLSLTKPNTPHSPSPSSSSSPSFSDNFSAFPPPPPPHHDDDYLIQDYGFKNPMPVDASPHNTATGFRNSSIWAGYEFCKRVNSLALKLPPASDFLNVYGINHEPNLSIKNQDCLQNGGKLTSNDLIKFAMTQEGSAKLVKILMSEPEFTSEIFQKVSESLDGIPCIFYLMIDQYGYHVFTKLIDSCTFLQLALIVHEVIKDQTMFIRISIHKHGSMSIKKLIKVVKKSTLVTPLVDCLSSVFFTLMTDRVGSLVISECLANLNVFQNKPLYEAAVHHGYHLAVHKKGCKSLQTFIDHIQGPHRYQLLDLIASSAVFLSQDPSGHFVVQKVLGLENPFFTEKICCVLKGYYATLSMQKGGSRVVENCLNSGSINYAVEDLLSNTSRLLRVARDRYGNYVIQRALEITKKLGSPLYQSLLKSLQLLDLELGYGKNVLKLLVNGGGDSVQEV